MLLEHSQKKRLLISSWTTSSQHMWKGLPSGGDSAHQSSLWICGITTRMPSTKPPRPQIVLRGGIMPSGVSSKCHILEYGFFSKASRKTLPCRRLWWSRLQLSMGRRPNARTRCLQIAWRPRFKPQKKLPQFTMCRNLPSTATYRAATYLVPQLTVPEISVPQFAYCRNLPPAATYRLPEFSVPQLAVAATFRSPSSPAGRRRTSWRTTIGCCGRSGWPAGRWPGRSDRLPCKTERRGRILRLASSALLRYVSEPKKSECDDCIKPARLNTLIKLYVVFLIQIWNVKIVQGKLESVHEKYALTAIKPLISSWETIWPQFTYPWRKAYFASDNNRLK